MKGVFVLLGLISLIHYKSASGASLKGRCINMWDEGCINGELAGSGRDDDFINGGFNPGKRCINMWDDGCLNGQLQDSGKDDDFMNGGFNPGKRCVGGNCNGRIFDLEKDGSQYDRQLIYNLLAKMHKNQH